MTAANGSDRITVASVAATTLITVVAVVSVVVEGLRPLGAIINVVVFFAGTLAFLLALVRAARRSRSEELSVGGLLLAGGVAPAPMVKRLYTLLAVQVVVTVVAASIRPYTPVAFGVLAPMAGLGCVALWAATNGRFPPRRHSDPRLARRAGSDPA